MQYVAALSRACLNLVLVGALYVPPAAEASAQSPSRSAAPQTWSWEAATHSLQAVGDSVHAAISKIQLPALQSPQRNAEVRSVTPGWRVLSPLEGRGPADASGPGLFFGPLAARGATFAAATANFRGRLTLLGRPAAPDPSWQIPISVAFMQPGTTTVVTSSTVTTDSSGNFAVNGVQTGTYDVQMKYASALSKLARNVSLQSGDNPLLDIGTLALGDVNGDDTVDLVDFSILRTTFGRCVGDSGFDGRADLSGDACVDLLDFSLLRTNFGESGPQIVTTTVTGPMTMLVGAPALNTAATVATFQFTGSDPNDTFQCALDGAAFTNCTSPVTYSGLSVTGHTFVVRAQDPSGRLDVSPPSFSWTIVALPPSPPEPATLAPALDPSVAVNLATSSSFLYSGSNPIQTGVAPGAIQMQQAAVLRGRVLTRDGQPLPGTTISVVGHPELGQTVSRPDGMFDLAVNGGGALTLSYVNPSYMPAERQIQTAWLDFGHVPDVDLVALDAQVTSVDVTGSSQTAQVAQGSAVSDADGQRQATVMVEPGTHATLQMASGSQQSLSAVHIRTTELTVGANGPNAMPAELPANTGYTYAVNVSIDEAGTAGAASVQFDQPVPYYVDNFLTWPAGTLVPSGYYSQTQHQWVASQNGVVIDILSVSNGVANLDVDGSRQPASTTSLTALGITTAELQQLATLYKAGQSLWRIPLVQASAGAQAASARTSTRLARLNAEATLAAVPPPGVEITSNGTYWDFNQSTEPAPPALSPPGACPASQSGSSTTGGTCTPAKPCGDSLEHGSLIYCERQALGEELPIAGTPFSLAYSSDRMPGRTDGALFPILLSTNTVSPTLARIDLEVSVAGRMFLQSFPPAANQTYPFVWDGKDVYGRAVTGSAPLTVRVGYVYPTVYLKPADRPGGNYDALFGHLTYYGTPITQNPARTQVTLWSQTYALSAQSPINSDDVGGWSVDIHHLYDPGSHTLYMGDGSQRSAAAMNFNIIKTRLRGTASRLTTGTAFAADGSLYVVSGGLANGPSTGIVQKVSTSAGAATIFAGGGSGCVQQTNAVGDGCPATAAPAWPSDGFDQVAVGPDGSVYIMETRGARIRRVTPDGIIHTVAGTGIPGYSGDNGPAVLASLDAFGGQLAIGRDGSIYIADHANNRIRRVSSDGNITTVAGDGVGASTGDGGPAMQAEVLLPVGMAVGQDGSVYFGEYLHASQQVGRIRRITTDGFINTVVGGGSGCSQQVNTEGDGCSALQAIVNSPTSIVVGTNGNITFTDFGTRVRQLSSTTGIVSRLAGGTVSGFTGDNGPALQARLADPQGLSIAPDNSLCMADAIDSVVRCVTLPFTGFAPGETLIPSTDGSEAYVFDASGRHVRTMNALTGALLYQFGFTNGRLSTITDGDGNVTTIQRDSSGNPTAIVAPFGQVTHVAVDANHFLSQVSDPLNQTVQLTSSAGGLISTMIDARGGRHSFTYDSLGRLTQDTDPAGGSTTIVRTDSNAGATYTISTTSALGRVSTYFVEQLGDGSTHEVVTEPDGTKTDTVIGSDGTTTVTSADGTTAHTVAGPDPRFGMLAPVDTSETDTTPSGLTLTTSGTRTAALSDPNNPFSLTTLTETSVINGRTYTRSFSQSTKTFTETTPAGRTRTTTIDALGRATREQVGNLLPVSYTYDSHGRLSSVSQGSGGTLRSAAFGYNANGFLSVVTDPLSQTTTLTNDLLGRATQEVLPGNRIVSFSYDSDSNVTGITPPGRPQHSFAYTPVDLPSVYTPPDVNPGAGQTADAYNADRQLTKVTLPTGQSINLGYDTAGRLNAVSIPRGMTSFTYDGAGRLATATSFDDVSLSSTYDGSLLTSEVISGPVSGIVSRTYDTDFRPTALSVDGSNAVTSAYDPDSLLNSAGALTLTHVPQTGRLNGTTLGIVSDSWVYNGFGEPAAYTATVGGTAVLSDQFTRDNLGRISTKAESVQGASTTLAYTYDVAGRLSEVQQNGSPVADYVYDGNGNRTRLTSLTGSVTATYDDQDRLVTYGSTTFTYTADGKLQSSTTAGQQTQYSFNELGNLESVTLADGTQVSYLTDPAGRRIEKAINGSVVQAFLYEDGLRPIAELDGNNNIVSRFVYATASNVPDYMIRGSTTFRVIHDYLGSARLVINSTTGQVVQRLDYDAFGQVLTDSAPGFQPFGFAGGIYDAQTQLVHFGARDYDARVGRWVTKDPIGFAGGLNSYVYVQNAPTYRRDPTGLTDGSVCEGSPMLPCPRTYSGGAVPQGWRLYPRESGRNLFHCGFNVLLENRSPTPDNPMNECAYDHSGQLVDENHEFAGCAGTPDQYDTDTAWHSFLHFAIDSGGIVRAGGPAFITSMRYQIKQKVASFLMERLLKRIPFLNEAD